MALTAKQSWLVDQLRTMSTAHAAGVCWRHCLQCVGEQKEAGLDGQNNKAVDPHRDGRGDATMARIRRTGTARPQDRSPINALTGVHFAGQQPPARFRDRAASALHGEGDGGVASPHTHKREIPDIQEEREGNT